MTLKNNLKEKIKCLRYKTLSLKKYREKIVLQLSLKEKIQNKKEKEKERKFKIIKRVKHLKKNPPIITI